MRARLAAFDMEGVDDTPEEAGRRIANENRKWGEVVARIGLQVD